MPYAKMYPVISVPQDAWDRTEQVGTKFKFWFDENTKLFKEARPGTGEDWAEKVAAELSNLLGLPHVQYDLGIWRGRRGVVSHQFIPDGGVLIHGNQLLVKVAGPNYPVTQMRGVRQHTLRVVLRVANALYPPLGFIGFPGVSSGLDVFIGYLLLDAWIGNNDRHHQNWGLVIAHDGGLHLAPTFDHASSLGRIETDDEKKDRLTTKDHGRSIYAYTQKCMSAFFHVPNSPKALLTLDVFRLAAKLHPIPALSWLKRLETVSLRDTESIFGQIPGDRISPVSIEFGQAILAINRSRLLGLVPEIIT